MAHLKVKENAEWREMRLQKVYEWISLQSPQTSEKIVQLFDEDGYLGYLGKEKPSTHAITHSSISTPWRCDRRQV